mmetsp:Transcript_9702/g.26300  ORF Transcript_9702/g.26300 Transcript_9702/m.26300 type:complete len:124 (+) Transcript_9702:284-655(+)
MRTPGDHAHAARASGYAVRSSIDSNPTRQARSALACSLNPPDVTAILPEHLAKVTTSMARSLGVPPHMLVFYLLSVISTVLGCSVRVSPHPNSTEALQVGVWTGVCRELRRPQFCRLSYARWR